MKKYKGYQRCSRIDYGDAGNIFAVTICTHERRHLLNDEINDCVVREIKALNGSLECSVYIYCIMPDHIHLVLSAGKKGVVGAVRTFKGRLAARTRAYREGGQKLWEGSFFDHRIRSSESFSEKCAYILNNPVRAGLCENAEDYPWSGVISMKL